MIYIYIVSKKSRLRANLLHVISLFIPSKLYNSYFFFLLRGVVTKRIMPYNSFECFRNDEVIDSVCKNEMQLFLSQREVLKYDKSTTIHFGARIESI